MKIKSLLFAAFAVCSMAASAQLAETTTLSHQLLNEGGSVEAGKVAYVGVTLTNPDAGYVSVEAHYEFPAGWTAVEFSQADAGIGTKTKKNLVQMMPEGRLAETDNHNAFSVTGAIPSENPNAYGWLFVNMDGDKVETGDDVVLVFAIQIPEDAVLGENTVMVSGQQFSTGDVDENEVAIGDGEIPDTTFPINVIAVAVNDVNATKAVAGVKYYNLAGVESEMPFDGVNVVVTTYTDGTKAASKVIK
ncbi:MAG: hypothetical protein J5523_08995 [Muribaculaceae bacterium]|nr:hypothetical protein [Muribaculaceae bacterium]